MTIKDWPPELYSLYTQCNALGAELRSKLGYDNVRVQLYNMSTEILTFVYFHSNVAYKEKNYNSLLAKADRLVANTLSICNIGHTTLVVHALPGLIARNDDKDGNRLQDYVNRAAYAEYYLNKAKTDLAEPQAKLKSSDSSTTPEHLTQLQDNYNTALHSYVAEISELNRIYIFDL